jgi:PAS domain-containing protein
MLGEYSIDNLLRYAVPTEISAKYAVTLLDSRGRTAGRAIPVPRAERPPDAALGHPRQRIRSAGLPGRQWPGPARPGLPHLAGRGRQRPVLAGGALSAMTAWMLIGNWRHTRRRMQAQQALVAETNFRRAMENSMLTGMRALDMQGRITYVNPAFCQMTGWSEAELVGRTAPFPYWPEEDHEMLARAPGRRAERQDPTPAALQCGSSARTARCSTPGCMCRP